VSRPLTVALTAVRRERYPIRGGFTISRGSKREAEVLVAELSGETSDGRTVSGRGECLPYARYGETVDGVLAAIEAQAGNLARGMDRLDLQREMPAGAARNALDCAFWDLEAKTAAVPVWRLAGLHGPWVPVVTAFTISLGTPERMGEAALGAAAMPLLKLKLGGDPDDLARTAAVRRNAPAARIIVDANESWTIEQLTDLAPRLSELGVELIEQPLPADGDIALANFRSPVPLGADESCHGTLSLKRLKGLKVAAEQAGFGIMVGCMVATSLAMAPAFLLAQGAAFADLDGPLLLERDREPGIAYDAAWMQPPPAALWG